MQFALVAAFAVAAASVQAVSVVDLGNDIKNLDAGVSALLKLVQGTDGSDLDADLKINKAAQSVNSLAKKTSKDADAIDPSDVSAALANGIISKLDTTEANTKKICKKLAADRSGYNAAGVPPFVYASTEAIAKSVKTVGASLVALAPGTAKTKAKALASAFNADLKICTDAYKDYDY